jgi:hypothetical protein
LQALTESIETLSCALADRRRADLAAAEAAASARATLDSALEAAREREGRLADDLRVSKVGVAQSIGRCLASG